ncbi:MAG: RNA polymerase sigma factor, partial [bacterium]
MTDATAATARAIEAVWRLEAPRILGFLVRLLGDVQAAEDAAQAVLLTALERWPTEGIPQNPGAWLVTAARHRAIDGLRRDARQARLLDAHGHSGPSTEAPLADEALDGVVGDDLLRLILVACNPVLAVEARVALTLRLLAGLTTAEIAHAYLVPEATVAQRIVRAKRTLRAAEVPFEVPRGEALAARLPAVLEAIYLIFNEGYAASRGDTWIRGELCQVALRLGRVLAGLTPMAAEVHGLVALMELHTSRLRARHGPGGQPVLLLDQDRGRWDHLLIQRGLRALALAIRLARPLGPYTLQAAISACHARARTAGDTDWHQIVALYDALVEATGSPVVELNRAVAVGMAFGPAEGLALVDDLALDPALATYPHLPAVRGDLLERLGRRAEARSAFEAAA